MAASESKPLNPHATPFNPDDQNQHGQWLLTNYDHSFFPIPKYSMSGCFHYYFPSSVVYTYTSQPEVPSFFSNVAPNTCLTEKFLKNPSSELSQLRLEVKEVASKKKRFGARVFQVKARNGRRLIGGDSIKSKPVSAKFPEKDIVDGVIFPFPTELTELEATGKTTVMIKNIPNQFTRRDLLRILNEYCRFENQNLCANERSTKSGYDFVYLPMDFNKYWHEKRIANLGYAFVNFTSPAAAWRFYKRFDHLNWNVSLNNKICVVTLARTQGRDALEESFRTKLFYCHSDEYLPLVITPTCHGFGSYRHGRNIGIRVSTFPRRRIMKSSSRPMPKLVCA